MFTSVTAVAQQVPAYCTSGHGILTPAQWKTCWNAGWSQPTTGAANVAQGGIGSVVLIVLAIVAVLWLLSKLGGSRAPATSKG